MIPAEPSRLNAGRHQNLDSNTLQNRTSTVSNVPLPPMRRLSARPHQPSHTRSQLSLHFLPQQWPSSSLPVMNDSQFAPLHRTFCKICRRVDLTASSKSSPTVDLGTVMDLAIRSSSCLLCKFVYRVLDWRTTTYIHLPEFKVYLLLYKIQAVEILLSANYPAGRPSLNFGYMHITLPRAPVHSSNYGLNSDVTTALVAAFKTRAFDPEEILHEMYQCEGSHPSCLTCLGRMTPMDIFLIDTERMCLVEGSSSQRYIALSYVWGGANTLTLKTTTLEGLLRPQSLERNKNDISQVIWDSIWMVKQLRERYLWVDSLCIVQDQEETKHSQISQMDIIYGMAVMTIASVSTRHANEVLLDFDHHLRAEEMTKVIEELQKRKKVTFSWKSYLNSLNSFHLPDVLKLSLYERRCWTFQERLLSRRVLYVTHTGVKFDCRKSPLTDMSAYGTSMNWKLLNPLWQEHSNQEGLARQLRQRYSGAGRTLIHYASLVENYSRRNLTYPTDRLTAFSGLLGSMTCLREAEPVSNFVCGLPAKYLRRAMLWIPRGHIPSASLETRHGFPTWCWASHAGAVTYPPVAWAGMGTRLHAIPDNEQWYTSLFMGISPLISAGESGTKPTATLSVDLDSMSIDPSTCFALHIVAYTISWSGFVLRKAVLARGDEQLDILLPTLDERGLPSHFHVGALYSEFASHQAYAELGTDEGVDWGSRQPGAETEDTQEMLLMHLFEDLSKNDKPVFCMLIRKVKDKVYERASVGWIQKNAWANRISQRTNILLV